MAVEYPNNCGSGDDMKVDGKAGVGTLSPTWKLQVTGGQSAIQPGSGDPGVFTILPSSTGGWWNIANVSDGKFVIDCGDRRSANDSSSWNNSPFCIVSTGKVGIGTTDPEETLDVDGAICIKDGIPSPSTHSGKASIYVDSSDGNLKIRFGNGTVKTIVTD
ncbi:MAG: hypothetical protein ACLFQK_00175 [Fibrobacterota bacterium]